MLGHLNTIEVEKVLLSQIIGRIGCYVNGQVYVVPITYAYDGSYIYGHSREGLKINSMRQHPKVCFEVDNMKDMANWQSVILQGEYQELLGQKARTAMSFLLTKLNPLLTSETSMLGQGIQRFHHTETSTINTVVFRIKILEKTGRFERK